MPQELEDPEDLTVSDPDVDHHPSPASLNPHEDEGDDDDDGDPAAAAPWRQGLLRIPKEIRNIMAGGIAGMVAKSVVAPLDRIKILYQVTAAEFKLRNVPGVARNIIRNEGATALWKGNVATMLRVFPYSGIQFAVFSKVKDRYLMEHDERHLLHHQHPLPHELIAPHDDNGAVPHHRKFGLTPLESLIAGMIAGTVSVVCTYPLDLTRAQLAVLRKHKHSHNRGFLSLVTDNYRHRGVWGLFRGMPVTLFGILPYSGIAFALNEQGKREVRCRGLEEWQCVHPNRPSQSLTHSLSRSLARFVTWQIQFVTGREVTTIERMQCGAVAGLFAQTITYPIEVTRRRMQTLGLVGNDTAFGNVGVRANDAVLARPPSLVSTIQTLYAEQGLRGFFKGVSVNWMKGPIAFSISFTMFDTMKQFLETPVERNLRRSGHPHRHR